MKQIYIVLSKKCNLACSYCIRDYENNIDLEIDFNKFLLLANKIKEIFIDTELVLTGGEPTLNSDFNKILEYSLLNFENISINSNGMTNFFYSDKFKEIILKYKLKIQLSIDGYEHHHDKFRGKGSYKRIIKLLDYLEKFPNLRIVISTTVVDKNFMDNFSNIYNDLIKYNLRWDIKRVTYSGKASDINYDMLINRDWNEIVDSIVVFDKKRFIRIFKTFDFDFLDRIDNTLLEKLEKTITKNCGSGVDKIYVYPNLDVLACTCYENFPSGNLATSTIEEILNSINHKFIINQKIDNSECNNCRYKVLCNGGCLGSGFSRETLHNLPDIKCPKIYNSNSIVTLN